MFNQSKAFAVGLLVAVFVAGLALGVASDRWVLARRGPPRRDARMSYVERLARDLQLTAVQRDSVSAIIRRHDPQMRAIFASVRPQMDSLRGQLANDIRAQLTDEQKAIHQRLLDRDRARFSRRDSADQRRGPNDDDD
jgi:hypothetical protein